MEIIGETTFLFCVSILIKSSSSLLLTYVALVLWRANSFLCLVTSHILSLVVGNIKEIRGGSPVVAGLGRQVYKQRPDFVLHFIRPLCLKVWSKGMKWVVSTYTCEFMRIL